MYDVLEYPCGALHLVGTGPRFRSFNWPDASLEHMRKISRNDIISIWEKIPLSYRDEIKNTQPYLILHYNFNGPRRENAIMNILNTLVIGMLLYVKYSILIEIKRRYIL